MNEFITRLFEHFNYEVMSEAEGVKAIKHREYKDFWVILNEGEDSILEVQEDVARKCEEAFAHKEAEKNTSLLVLRQVEQMSDVIIDEIVEIENDPFYFKKYVLAYTESSKKFILKYGVEDFSAKLMDSSNFQQLKEEAEASRPYHLLYSIAHKLPFIMTNVEAQDTTTLNSNQYTPKEELQEAFNWLQSIDFQAEDLEREVREKLENLNTTEDETV